MKKIFRGNKCFDADSLQKVLLLICVCRSSRSGFAKNKLINIAEDDNLCLDERRSTPYLSCIS